jgi:hypothetical protein
MRDTKAMGGRRRRIDEEAAELWRSLHDGPPPEGLDGPDLIAAALKDVGIANYNRLANPWLRDRNLVWPK